MRMHTPKRTIRVSGITRFNGSTPLVKSVTVMMSAAIAALSMDEYYGLWSAL
jgi:hypothetical protein